ncbi:hypothetical protein [Arthrobacter sp. fls2-241-R2A-200]|uniref:hypothetical protein n=1 Tax=Arthrobacter sp. fls2-241-R2A-200 TaxID=3040281 RepID=UPI00254A2F8E|nr:hypothetical protein [Arthrobacter sp. fls2-241-R2A-200]
MNVVIVVFGISAGLSAAYWGRYRFPVVRRGSVLDERLGLLNLYCVAVQGVVAIALALSTNMAGLPALAFAASGLLLAAVPLYLSKRRDPRLAAPRREGSHVNEESALKLTSRWPYTVVYTAGYVALFSYVLSLGIVVR